MKFYNKLFWRAGSTQADKYAKLGQNGLYMLAAISKMANCFNFILGNFESQKHPQNIS